MKESEKVSYYKVVFANSIDKKVISTSKFLKSVNCQFTKNVFKIHIETYISDGVFESYNLDKDCYSSMQNFLIETIHAFNYCAGDFAKFIDKYNKAKANFLSK